MSTVYDFGELHGGFNKSFGSNTYSDWLSPTSDDSSRLDDEEYVVKEREHWRNIVHKALKEGNDQSLVSSTQDESDVSSFPLETIPDFEISYVWSVPILPFRNSSDSSVDPDKCEAEPSLASDSSSIASVPFVSLDISLEEPTTTTPLICFNDNNEPSPSNTAATLALPLSIPPFIYVPLVTMKTGKNEPEMLDIYDPTDLQIFNTDDRSWPEPVHRLHRLLLQYSQASCPSDSNEQLFFTDVLSCIQEHPETCLIRYPLPRPLVKFRDTFSDSGYYFPLTYFCFFQCLEGVRVAYQACPEVVGCINDPVSGWIPLAFACLSYCHSTSSLELIKFVISVYPDGVRRTTVQTQETILHSLCQLDPDPEIVRLLLEHYPTAAQLPDAHGYSPVMYLCRNTMQSTTGRQLWPLFWRTSPLTVQAVTPQSMEKLLHIACRYNIHQYALIESILAEDPSQCQYTDCDFQLPIHKAVQCYVDLSPDDRIEALRSIVRLVGLYPKALEWRDDHDETPRDIFMRLFATDDSSLKEEQDYLSLLELIAIECN